MTPCHRNFSATNLEVIAIADSLGIDIEGKMSTSIPLLWGELMTSLRVIELYDNSLSGEILDSLWRLSTQEYLSLDGNGLTRLLRVNLDHLPDTVQFLKILTWLSLQENHVTGTPSSFLDNLSNLLEGLELNKTNSPALHRQTSPLFPIFESFIYRTISLQTRSL